MNEPAEFTFFTDRLVTTWHAEGVDSELVTRGTSELDGNLINHKRPKAAVSITIQQEIREKLLPRNLCRFKIWCHRC